MINYIFGCFLIIGVLYGIVSGNMGDVNQVFISSGGDAVDICFKMIPIICLWMGIMNIALKSNLLDKLSKYASIIIKPLFPEIKNDSVSIGYIASNIIMNMLGLGNAATPFGIKAMKSMQDENKNKDVASRSMITFLVINTASVTLIPTTVISFRILNKANNPTDIIPGVIITTFLSLIIGLVVDRLFAFFWRKYG